jgi:signal transduction histidine kinase
MKPAKIYLKIFFSFLLILIVTEVLIFGLFGVITGRHFRSQMERYASVQVMMVKKIIESKVRSEPDSEPARNESLKAFIRELGEGLEAQVWLQRQDGRLVATSFPGDVPVVVEQFKKRQGKDFGSFTLYHERRRGAGVYAVVPIALAGDEGFRLHLFLARSGSPHPERGFAVGLGIIGAVIALLVIPVSRFISKPINELRRSAQRIAEGDLSHRASVHGEDEIGKLGRTFNHMADKLERMIRGGRELTAHISHQLRTPLTRIRIAEEMLREKTGQRHDAALERYLNDIREDIDELDVLIGRILSLSRLDLNETPLRPEPLDPVDLINQLLNRLKPAMEQKSLRLTTGISFEQPFRGDRNALGTAFSNILENAVKYCPKEGSLAVEMKALGGSLEVTVSNTFEPLEEEDLERIFEPFQRAETAGQAGFGLGLAIARKIIEAHGGAVRAQNSQEGFSIRMSLPGNPPEEHVLAQK